MATKDTGGQRQASKRTEDTEEAEPQASGDVKERQEKLADDVDATATASRPHRACG